MRLGGAIVASAARLFRPISGTEGHAAILLTVRHPSHQPSATLTSKAVRGEVIKPPPFPYRTKRYNSLRAWFDKTSPRLDENSKLIIVDGPPTAGKGEVAKGMAELLDFLYVPAADMNMVYVNEYGKDLRSMNDRLPPHMRTYDLNDFNRDPFDARAHKMQNLMYGIRYNQYIDALAHILNTGQGVVMDRSVYSDKVYVDTMVKNGYLRKEYLIGYGDLTHETLRELMRPHLIVYLDLPVPEIQKRLKNSRDPALQDSKAMTPQFLKDLEYYYKMHYLKTMEEHCHLLVYDWTDARGLGDVEGIVEDAERLEFEKHEVAEHDPKMKDWWFPVEDEWCEARFKYTTMKNQLLSYLHMPGAWLDCPEVFWTAEEGQLYYDTYMSLPGNTYAKGFNTDLGDSSVLFKWKKQFRPLGTMFQDRAWWIPEK